MTSSLNARSPVAMLQGVGPKSAEKLAQLNIHTVQDLWFHLPHRYEDRTRLVSIQDAPLQDGVVIEGRVVSGRMVYGGRRSFLCTLEDDTALAQLRFFYVHAGLIQQLSKENVRVRCFGSFRQGAGHKEMVHPEWQVINEGDNPPLAQALTPVYPTTAGVSVALLRKLIDQAISVLKSQTLEWLPAALQKKMALPTLDEALIQAHHPAPGQALDVRRLAFEELLVHTLRLQQARLHVQRENAIAVPASTSFLPQLRQSLPYALTAAQERVINEIMRDLNTGHPMMRLLQGDVGAGKTLVAFATALCVLEAGQQVAMMAPTEILAEQHYRNWLSGCESLGIQCECLTGSTPSPRRSHILSDLQKGVCQLIIGTHALFQNKVNFHSLALVIIDEQHRFGVEQRAALVDKGRVGGFVPHRLVMTATPIPRTLAMTAYADLDCSVIDELPPGRTPVQTVAIAQSRRSEVIERVRQNCVLGQQVYWVCTLIEVDEEGGDISAAEQAYEDLAQALAPFRVGLVHGRLSAADKDLVMQQFKAGELSILVATTVIEVGVDVPNATLMVIENPERLGLSQLHQLRGRVGRGAKRSACVLLYKAGLSQMGRARIDILRQSNDGFVIAEKDLALRGPGELLGVRQSGMVSFKFADLCRDQPLIPKVHIVAETLRSDHPQLIEPLLARW